MSSRRRYVLVAIALLAAASYGAQAAERMALRDLSEFDGSECASASLSVYRAGEEVDADDTVSDYDALSDRQQSAFDRARRAGDGYVSVEPTVLSRFPRYVRYRGTTYEVGADYEGCPEIWGTPRELNVVVVPLQFLWNDVFRGPLGIVIALVVAALVWREIDEWLQY